MARFVHFPGTAGSYASTDDVNLLDADSAHFVQSNPWGIIAGGGFTNLGTSALHDPIFGDSVGVIAASGTPASFWIGSADGNRAPVVATQQYTGRVAIRSELTGRHARLDIFWFESGGGSLPQSAGTFVPVTDTGYTVLEITATAPATAAFARLGFNYAVEVGGNLTDAEEVYLDVAGLRDGTDAAFVPSLRIVGDLEVEADVAATDWTSGAGQFIMSTEASSVGYRLIITGAGLIQLLYASGTNAFRQSNSAAFVLVNGERTLIKITANVTTGDIESFQDNVSVDSQAAGAGAGVGVQAGLFVGSSVFNAEHFTGDVYGAVVRDGIDGPIVAVFDPDDISI